MLGTTTNMLRLTARTAYTKQQQQKVLIRRFHLTRPVQNETPAQINWQEFFQLRKQRRLWERLAALPCSMLAVFASLPINPQTTLFGVDPIVILGGATMFCGVMGFAVGPSVGRVWYKIGNRRLAQTLDQKEAESDPSFSSVNNPLPDFYGEKINSLQGYRKWLRKQREHERKGTFKLGASKK
ncbi:mitochondrial import protein Pam17 [Linderina pennispora]|uniref:Presequence translocated-associated motor subunit PAM17 n=1 Tax=Linderina pennispora TaxID=61395 RepID=A0A1Y1WLB4_9FUNG|nr:mitochondrial import protein Pam17 [Linderina pennispora]ORX74293.1 mitochondrial import protein Pam17 [Linderina pennispora]